MASTKRDWTNLAFYLGMVGTNLLANVLKIGGGTTADVSAKYQNVFTPAGWTFSIWGAIYLLLLIPIVGQLINPDGKSARLMKEIKWWFPVSCVLNAVWMITWHLGKITISFITMLALLGSLFLMYTKYSKAANNSITRLTKLDTAGLSMYFGWICVASLANTMVLLVSYGVDGFVATAQIVAGLSLILGATTLMLLSILGNWIIAATGIWAYIGVLYSQISDYDTEYKIVFFSALIGIWILATGMVIAITAITKPKEFNASAA